MTAGRLREILADLPDDLEIEQENFESEFDGIYAPVAAVYVERWSDGTPIAACLLHPDNPLLKYPKAIR